ncbi:hypothetical protein BJY00DRAFT_313012 [Aspergillus carlsbadensis]|nr:hypothetical protein BJY00DRAFT_313012 [Aspergillus carlsbadensis]
MKNPTLALLGVGMLGCASAMPAGQLANGAQDDPVPSAGTAATPLPIYATPTATATALPAASGGTTNPFMGGTGFPGFGMPSAFPGYPGFSGFPGFGGGSVSGFPGSGGAAPSSTGFAGFPGSMGFPGMTGGFGAPQAQPQTASPDVQPASIPAAGQHGTNEACVAGNAIPPESSAPGSA